MKMKKNTSKYYRVALENCHVRDLFADDWLDSLDTNQKLWYLDALHKFHESTSFRLRQKNYGVKSMVMDANRFKDAHGFTEWLSDVLYFNQKVWDTGDIDDFRFTELGEHIKKVKGDFIF